MKKTIQILFAALMVFSVYNASGQMKFQKGDALINLGVGAGYYYAGGVSGIASAEFFVNDALSVGPYVGLTSYNYNYNFGSNYKYRYTFIDFGGRISYHYSKHLNLRTDKLDLYGGALLGFVASSYSGTKVNGYNDPYDGSVRAGIFAGVRYFFTPVFAVNGEVGYGITPLILGITFRIENPATNHYYGSVGRVGRALSESSNRSEIEKAILSIITDPDVDYYNRLLFYYLFKNYNYYITDETIKKENEEKLAIAVASLPEYFSSKLNLK